MSDPRLSPKVIQDALSCAAISPALLAYDIVKAIAEAPEPTSCPDCTYPWPKCDKCDMAYAWWKAACALVGGDAHE